ncbi:MAG: hypothetical protein IMZ53_00410 [Thermoplasmata archaeon]|nr:hypothetical protein [Thermoplasmata archaeon]
MTQSELDDTHICGICNSELIRRPDLDLLGDCAYACFDNGHVSYEERINAMWIELPSKNIFNLPFVKRLVNMDEVIIAKPLF